MVLRLAPIGGNCATCTGCSGGTCSSGTIDGEYYSCGNDNNAAIRMKAAVAKPGDAPAAAEAAMQAAFVYLLARITVRVAALVGANIGVAAHRPIFVALLLTS